MSRPVLLVLTCMLLVLVACAPSAQPTAEPPARNILSQVPSSSAGAPISTATVPPAAPTVAPTLARRATAAPTFAVPKAPKNSAQAMEKIARTIYDASSAQEDLQTYLAGVMTAFGVPPLGADEVAKADARYKQGLPLIFLPQLAQMADEFSDGDLYTLDSFIASANARGARQRGTDRPLTREYLTLRFDGYAGKSQYESRHALPAFVLALGKERARRSPSAKADPLWGDGLLDPLQTALLIYSVSYAGAKPLPHAELDTGRPGRTASFLRLSPLRSPVEAQSLGEHPIVGWITDQITGEVTGEIKCWGYNYNGQLGIMTKNNSSVPVNVFLD